MNPLFEGKTFYDILEIPSDASPHEIKIAYERAKATYSPSSPALYTIFTDEETQELNKLLETAYNILSHPGRRIEYDKTIDLHKGDDRSDFTTDAANGAHSASSSNEAKGNSQFGNYVIDEQFEERIRNATDIDGAFLQKIRHYKNITLDQLSEKSKISKTYILAIESHDFESLPARVFVRGFIVQLAKLLDIDEQRAANLYMKHYPANS